MANNHQRIRRPPPQRLAAAAVTALVSFCWLISTAHGTRQLAASTPMPSPKQQQPQQQQAPSAQPALAPPTSSCGEALQLLGANGLPIRGIDLPVRLSSTSAAVSSTSAIKLNASWNMLWRLTMGGYPNWYLNVTDLDDATVQLNFFTETEWRALYNGSRGCQPPQSAWLPPAFNDLHAGVNVGKSIYTLRSNLVALKPCQPFTVYLVAKITAAVAGLQQPQTLWAAADWVRANDPTNRLCPDSPTSWGYTQVTAMYCPCAPQSPPPRPSPPAPPLPPPPTCSDSRLLLSRNGVYTDTIVTPALNGWTMQPVSPSVITMNVTWNLSMSAAVESGQPVWAVNWTGIGTPPQNALMFLLTVNETVFRELYGRKRSACQPPNFLQNAGVPAWINRTVGVGPLGFLYGNLTSMLKPCRPLTLYMMAQLQDYLGLNPPVWSGADWVQANDPGNTVCPQSTTNWAYTRFEVTYCPCKHPQQRSPPRQTSPSRSRSPSPFPSVVSQPAASGGPH